MRVTELETFVIGNPEPGVGGRYFLVVKLTTDDGIVEIVEAVKDGRIQHYRDKRYHNVSL